MVDFFNQQKAAAKRSFQLRLVFYVVVSLTIVALTGLTLAALVAVLDWLARHDLIPLIYLIPPPLCILLVAVVCQTITFYMLRRTYRIFETHAQQAAAPALALGGQAVSPFSEEAGERRLINVVQEMALASGCPVPLVYRLPGQTGINSFAAGVSLARSVICVTDGALSELRRDELQALVAHEFAHIFYGDTRFNIELLSMLSALSVFSDGALRLMERWHSLTVAMRENLDKRTKEDWKHGILALLWFPLLAGSASCYVVASLGVFMGRVVKAGFLRTREFFADACAVRYTRYPDGLADALIKIHETSAGSKVKHFRSEELSHFFFARATEHFAWLDSHPPMLKRIRRWRPGYQAEKGEGTMAIQAAAREDVLWAAANGCTLGSEQDLLPTDKLKGAIGELNPAGTRQAQIVLRGLPPQLVANVESAAGGAALFRTLAELQGEGGLTEDPTVAPSAELREMFDSLERLSLDERFFLLNLSMPHLQDLTAEQLNALASSLREIALRRPAGALFAAVLGFLAGVPKTSVHFQGPRLDEEKSAALLLRAFVRGCSGAASQRDEAWKKGAEMLRVRVASAAVPEEAPALFCSLLGALSTLERSGADFKQRLLSALLLAIEADGKVTRREAAYFRVTALALNCPVSPFVNNVRSTEEGAHEA